jgi:hypothetical protein
MATHTPAELSWAAQQLTEAAREAGATPAALAPGATELFLYDAELDEPAFERAA